MTNRDPNHNTDLYQLYPLYAAYQGDLARDTGREHFIHDYPEFCQWWAELSPAVRTKCERDYHQGYEAAVDEGRRDIADAVFGRGTPND